MIDKKSNIDIISNVDYRKKRLDKVQARKLVSQITAQFPANIRYSKHALEELKKDDLTVSDVLNIIKSSDARIVKEPDLENGSYRYRLETKRITVVVSFDSSTSFVVVTAWRNKL